MDALMRIEEGAYANLVLPAFLDRSRLESRDRAFATDLVYGTTRMRRACDWLIDRYARGRLDSNVRVALRLGVYQLVFLGTPPHAAVSATVEVAPVRARSLVNAVLRRVADGPVEYPDEATALSYPDWVLERLSDDLGAEPARAALAAMNRPPEVTRRPDGYVQDLASQWVAAAVEVEPGDRVLDLCAAPGGKATAMAHGSAALVAASDVSVARLSLITGNARAVGTHNVAVVGADGTAPPYRPRAFDRVLVDAPCSGLGVLRRRPDARWRIDAGDVDRLAQLQHRLIDAAIPLVRPGGTLVYSVCTLTAAETIGVDEGVAARHPELIALPRPEGPWEPAGRGARLLPQTADTDGMFILRLRTP
jgi:16S rRNA (cytosine967-C5)-methyltransferase